jgi:hypothetical protein
MDGVADSLEGAAPIDHRSWPRELVFVLRLANRQLRAMPIAQIRGFDDGKLCVF